MVNDAADKAIPCPPAVTERILWRMKNRDRAFSMYNGIHGPPPGAWKYQKEKARKRFDPNYEIKRKSWGERHGRET